jgi:FkbM family methyltransferase
MNLFNTLKVLNYHPLTRNRKFNTVSKYFKYRILHKFIPFPFLYSSPYYKNGIKFIIKELEQFQLIYTDGFPEFYELSFLLHFLRPGDNFIDIGANKGLFSILGSGYCDAKSIAFEPVPRTFKDLEENVNINNLDDKIRLINAGVGSKNTIAKFSVDFGSANSIVTKADEDNPSVNAIDVQVFPLDEIIQELHSPTLLKIDVEGFEYEVIQGAMNTLKKNDVKAVIIELNGAGEKFNYREEDIHSIFISLGFKPYRYFPIDRNLVPQETHKSFINEKYMSDNTIYIRDLDFVSQRIRTAEKIRTAEFAY